MNYVTTNIRLAEEDYLRLKYEAAKARKSLAAIVREKISEQKNTENDDQYVADMLSKLEEIELENAKYTKGFDSVKALRQIRYEK